MRVSTPYLCCLLALAALGSMARLPAREPTVEIIPPPTTGCTNCNSGLLSANPPPPDHGPLCNCGACGQCVPGRTKDCYPCEGHTFIGRFLCGVYECICCPDPCYEGTWCPLADSAFFVEAVRPITQSKIRYDSLQNFVFPDRSEYFWARADGMGKGPSPRSPLLGETRLRDNEFILITEGGNGMISLVTEIPYRNIQSEFAGHAAGFADMSIATKTLLFDCELLQIAFQFKTFLPVGNVRKGLGTGHVSLEPSLLLGIKVSPHTYLQTQLSEWIPIGGDPDYQGSILHVHGSVNHLLYRILPDVPLIGTLECNCWNFQDGAFTDPFRGPFQKSSGTKYVTLGAGLRLFVCDRIDLGFGAAFAVSDDHFAEQTYRTEFRLRY